MFSELGSGFERCLFAEKKRSFSKLNPKKSSLVQDVGLRQRGLGGIPVEAVSGTCNNHRVEKVNRVAAVSEERVGVEMFSFLSLCVFVFLNEAIIPELGGQLTCVASLFGRCLVAQTRSE